MIRAVSRAFFGLVHGNRLVYNTCWEDPRLDRTALGLSPGDRLVMITSAGCNALDYALDEPSRIDAVDLNPRQNALLELKQAAIRGLDFERFFSLFGQGVLATWPDDYRARLRPQLSEWSRRYWDSKGHYFMGPAGAGSFYFRGTTGQVARGMNLYIDHVARAREAVDALLAARTLDDQREIYTRHVKPRIWTPLVRWVASRDATLALLAVPRLQREHLEQDYRGGIGDFIEERLDEVFTSVAVADNYFWRVYLTGAYTPTCCPEYLKPHNFERLQRGLVDRIHTHTSSLLDFLSGHEAPVSRFVLLDHMDWLGDVAAPVLAAEWDQILRVATPGARVLWRSGGRHTEFVDRLTVSAGGRRARLGTLLSYAYSLSASLHARDRVRTYGSFHIADLATG